MKKFSEFQKIVVLTGAGISAESGLKTFRDNDGLWEGHRVEEVATPEAFERSAQTVHRFYNMRRSQLLSEAEPNLAHKALAEFEQSYSGEFLLVTQNVDDLHERAGSINLRHMHGELLKVRCTACGSSFRWLGELSTENVCQSCHNNNCLRPDIVWFGEIPMFMSEIQRTLAACDLFVSIGTSGNVYPAAGFVQIAAQYGGITVELNLEKSAGNHFFDHSIQGPAGELVPQLFR